MPTNQTSNYSLSQWVKSDQVRMEDFNDDNAKIDAALKAEAEARAASDAQINQVLGGKASASALSSLSSTVSSQAAAIAKLGNCILHYSTYTGTAASDDYTAQRTLTFPHRPIALLLMHDGTYCGLFAVRGAQSVPVVTASRGYSCTCSWSGNSVTLTSAHTNISGRTYFVAALLDAEQ